MSLYFSKYPTLSKHFMLNLEELIQKEGEEMARLNGFSDSQLNKTDFIDNFIEKSTVADASVDGNANVSHKDIVTLMGEMPKAEQKLLGFNKIFYKFRRNMDMKLLYSGLHMNMTGISICMMLHLSASFRIVSLMI